MRCASDMRCLDRPREGSPARPHPRVQITASSAQPAQPVEKAADVKQAPGQRTGLDLEFALMKVAEGRCVAVPWP